MWGNEFAEVDRPLEELPGHRLGGDRGRRCGRSPSWCNGAAAADKKVAQQVGVKVRQARTRCSVGPRRLPGRKRHVQLLRRPHRPHDAPLPRPDLRTSLGSGCRKTSRTRRPGSTARCAAAVEDRLRELSYCRTRMDQLIQAMESPLVNLPGVVGYAGVAFRGVAAADDAPDQHAQGGAARRRHAHRAVGRAGGQGR